MTTTVAALLLTQDVTAQSIPQIAQSDAQRGPFVGPLRKLMRDGKLVGRVSYGSATCDRGLGYVSALPRFPPIRAGEDAVAIMRAAFRSQPDVQIVERPGHIVHVHFAAADDAILQTRIDRLELLKEEQYDPVFTIPALLGHPALSKRIKERGIQMPIHVLAYLMGPMRETDPHLPRVIENMTADEILDLIAQKFGAIIIFTSCQKPLSMDIDSTKIDPSWEF